jgi:nitrogen PTS system EIIA component
MNMLQIVRRECVAAGAAAADKAGIIRKIAELCAASPALNGISADEIEKGLLEREALGSTGFGRGIAIPHCRLDDAREFVVGVVSVPEGVEFDSMDGGDVRLLVFIVGPSENSSDHIKVLSTISRILSEAEAVEEMIAAKTAEALYESFVRHLRDEPRADAGERKSLFHVFVHDEELFRQLLEVFGSTEPRFTAVIEAENASSYLSKVPLFAGVWADDPRTFSRIIISLVQKRMTNELVRRIEAVTGPLSKSHRVLVTVQDVFFCGGSLQS